MLVLLEEYVKIPWFQDTFLPTNYTQASSPPSSQVINKVDTHEHSDDRNGFAVKKNYSAYTCLKPLLSKIGYQNPKMFLNLVILLIIKIILLTLVMERIFARMLPPQLSTAPANLSLASGLGSVSNSERSRTYVNIVNQKNLVPY